MAIWKIKERLTLDEYVLRCGEEGRLQPGMQQRFDQLLQDRSTGEWQAEEMVGPSQPPPKDDQEDTDLQVRDIQSTTLAHTVAAAEVEVAVLALQQSEEEEAQGM